MNYIYEVFTLCDSSFQAQAYSFELKRLNSHPRAQAQFSC